MGASGPYGKNGAIGGRYIGWVDIRGFRALLAVVVLGLLVFEGGAQTPADENDPPAVYFQHPPELGLEILDVTDLPGIGSKLYHLRISGRAHPFEARDKHETKFANVLVDAHHHFENHKAKIEKEYTPQAATNWQKAPRGCVSESWTTCAIKSIPSLRA